MYVCYKHIVSMYVYVIWNLYALLVLCLNFTLVLLLAKLSS